MNVNQSGRMSEPTDILVFYDDDIDGAAAAWAFNESLNDDGLGEKVRYVPVGYDLFRQDKILQNCAHLNSGGRIIFLDTAPDNQTLDLLFRPTDGRPNIATITIVDHHSSEIRRLQNYANTHRQDAGTGETQTSPKPNLDLILDSKKPAAALLAWEHFNPGKLAPDLFNWIGKMEADSLEADDEWARAALIDGEDISTPEMAFQAIDYLINLKDSEMVASGNSMIAGQFSQIQKALKNSMTYASLELLPGMPPMWVPLINANVLQYNRRIDQAFLKAAEGYDVVGIWNVNGDAGVSLSLRSNGVPDVGEIAKYLKTTIARDGGGRATAAAVHFDDIHHFLNSVKLCSKEQMTAAKWAPAPASIVGHHTAAVAPRSPINPAAGRHSPPYGD